LTKNILKILLITIVILLSFLLPKKTLAVSNLPSYYGYLSKARVTEVLQTHSEIPEFKKAALMNKLSLDGYFWMETKQEKLDYIHANLPNNKYLIVVADAEDVHSDQGATTPEMAFSESEEVQTQILDEVLVGFRQWANFYIAVAKEPGHRYESGDKGCFSSKGYWSVANLNKLYNEFWPDFKTNRNQSEFTNQERARLEKIYVKGNFQEIAKNLQAWRAPGSIGYFSNSAFEDLLMFVPIEKLAVIMGKFCVKKVGGWCANRAATTSPSIARGIRLGVQRAISRIQGNKFFEITSRYLGRVLIQEQKMFRYSSFSAGQRSRVAMSLTTTVSRIKRHPVFGEYLDPVMGRRILENTEVWVPHRMNSYSKGKTWWGFCVGNQKTFQRVVINEEALWVGLEGQAMTANKTMAHETFHALQANVSNYSTRYRSSSLGYAPLSEGMTESLSGRYMMSIYGKSIELGAYQAETKVADEIIRALQRKYGVEAGWNIAAELYFKSGLVKMDLYLAPGAHDKIYSWLVHGRADVAITYLRNIN